MALRSALSRGVKWTLDNPYTLMFVLCLVAIHGWFIAAAVRDFHSSIFLLVVIALWWIYVAGSLILPRVPFEHLEQIGEWLKTKPWISVVVGLCSMIVLFVLLFAFAIGSPARLYSTGCLIIIIIVSVLISDNPGRIKWRPVISGILLQYVLAFLVIRWPTGNQAIQFAADKIVGFLGFTRSGTSFTFAYIPDPPNICGMDGPFSFTSLPIIVYFSALCALWYYWGIMQWVLRRVSVIFQWIMATTAAESLNAVSSAFMGPTETAVLMRYALPSMTQSEIVATLAVNYSMISGSLFATYISYGACAPLLLAANIMSAPATLVISKIVSPEVQKSRQQDMDKFEFPPCEDISPLQAISNGAVSAVQVVFAIIACLIVFLAGIAFIDSAIGYLASRLGYEGVTFDLLMGYVFFPLAFLMGSSTKSDLGEMIAETLKVAQLIGSKTVLNEFIAYQKMQGMLLRKEISPRGQMIAIFALCGYSNPSNIGSVLAQFAAMCPQRLKSLVPAATKGFYIGSLACFMTACVAGSLIDDDSLACMPTDPGQNCLNLQDVERYFGQNTTLF